MRDIGLGTAGFFGAFSFAFRHGLWWLFLIPIALWSVFAAGMVWLGAEVVDVTGQWIAAHLHIDVDEGVTGGWPGLWESVKAFFDASRAIIVAIVLKLALFFLLGLIGKYVVLILMSPILAYASERTEEILTGRSYPFRLGPFLKDVLRGAAMALRNGALELAINSAVWCATLFFAPVAPLSVIFLWAVSCWFYGFSMFDYLFERHRLGIGASVAKARSRVWLVVSNGGWFWLLLKVPLLGLMFAPVLASIGAVLAWPQERSGNNLAPNTLQRTHA